MRCKPLVNPAIRHVATLVLALLFIIVCDVASGRDKPPEYQVITGEQRFTVDVALSAEQRRLGLMHRRELEDGYGLLMVLDRNRIIPIWMKNMHFPLDVVWINSTGRVVEKTTLPVCRQSPCQVYTPGSPARYVLEVGAGKFFANIGDKIEIFDASGDSLLPPDSGRQPRSQ